eukprot:EG_transcript_15609
MPAVVRGRALALCLCHVVAALALPVPRPPLSDWLGPAAALSSSLDAVQQGLRREAGLFTLRRALASAVNWTAAQNSSHSGGGSIAVSSTLLDARLFQTLLSAEHRTISFQDFLKGYAASDSTDIVSNSRYRGLADAVIGQTPIEAIRNRSLVFVNAASGARVAALRQVLGQLTVRIFLLQCTDHAVFDDWLLSSPAVLLLFACHVPVSLHTHPKVRIIPLGVPQVALRQLAVWSRALPSVRPVHEVFVQFSIRSPAVRAKVRRRLMELLHQQKLLHSRGPVQRMPQDAYLKRMVQSRFVISPRGVGLDTYRTWEALALGRVPVVERLLHPFLYVGLPVVQLDSWQQVNSSLLVRSWAEMQQQRIQARKISFAWWMLYIALQAVSVK